MSATDATLSRFRMIVLEIHHLSLLSHTHFLHGVFLPVFERLSKTFPLCSCPSQQLHCGSTTFHGDLVVPNVLELTFLRRDRLRSTHVLLSSYRTI